MKRKRGNGKRKPKKPPVVGANEAFLNADDHSGLDDFDYAEFDSRVEAESPQADTSKSGWAAGLERQGVVNERMEDSTNSLPKMNKAVSGNLSRKAGSIRTKLSRGFGSSSINPSNTAVLVQGERTHQNEPNLAQQDPPYKEQDLNVSLLVIKKIMKMDAAEPFNVPVNPIALGIPDYFDVIDTPMDFGTICNNLENGLKYMNSEDVFKDVQYIWENCYKYNKKGDYILELMNRVKKNFMKYWTAAGLYREQPRPISGISHLPPPADSTMRCSKRGDMCPVSPMTGNPTPQQQDLIGQRQLQHHQLSPCYSQSYQPQQRACHCQSSSREPQPQAGSKIASAGKCHLPPPAESTMRCSKHGDMCPVSPATGNPTPQQQDLIGQRQLQHHQLSPCYSHLYQPQQRACHCQSSFREPQPQAGAKIASAGYLHLTPTRESTLRRSKRGRMCPVGSMNGNPSKQQQDETSLGQVQPREPSSSYSLLHHPQQRSCQCQSSSSPLQSSQLLASINIDNAGHLHSPPPMESTVRQCKHMEECPVGPVNDSPGLQPQDQTGPSQVWSHQPSSIHSQACQPQQRASQCQPSSSQPRPSLPLAGMNIGGVDSASMKRRTRGPTRCLKLLKLQGERISITTNVLGQPIGLEAPNLTNFLGIIARNGHMAPLTYVDWRAVPDANKEDMWQKVQSKFKIDPKSKSWVLKSIGKKWKDWKAKLKAAHYNTHATDGERLADCDERVLQDQWPILISFWNSEESKKRGATNKANRAQQKFGHTTGTKSFARLREEQRSKRPDGKEPSRAELFILTRTRKDGQPMHEAASIVISQLRELASQQQETSQNSTARDDIFSQVMGKDRHGRVRTYGLGPSPSDMGDPKRSPVEAMRMVSEASAEVREMKEKMVAMEQTCSQMAAQMAAMMSMMSTMQRRYTDESAPNVGSSFEPLVTRQVANNSGASRGSLQQQVRSSSRLAVASHGTRATKRGKTQKASISKVAQKGI